MANKKLIQGISVFMLLCAAIFLGCEDDVPEEGNPWSNITSLAQVDGIWKGSDTQTQADNGLTIATTYNITLVINASAETITVDVTVIIAFSGDNLSNYAWNAISATYTGTPGVTVNDTTHSITISQSIEKSPADASDMDEAQISQDGQKLRMPASEDSPEMILTKQ
jgi:hypothetical protein